MLNHGTKIVTYFGKSVRIIRRILLHQRIMATTDFILRFLESTAFSMHAILGLTEPFTGCLRRAFGDGGAMPIWFWPVAGAILFLVAYFNFSGNNALVLAAQAYIVAFHIGAVMYHNRLGHHPAAGLAPSVFVVFAFVITVIRTNVLVALVGTCACAGISAALCRILVNPKNNEEAKYLQDDDQSPEEKAQGYMATTATAT